MGLLVSLFLISCSKPDVKKILKKSYKKCQSIKKGYYEMTFYMKYMTEKDTSCYNFNCYFEKLSDDTIYSFVFTTKIIVMENIWET